MTYSKDKPGKDFIHSADEGLQPVFCSYVFEIHTIYGLTGIHVRPFVFSENADILSHGYKPVGGMYPETSVGWYRKYFTISKSDSIKHFQLKFDGVFRDANFWINGFYLGNNKSGYIGATYDITDFTNFDKDNVIVVRVDATQYEGWFYEGAGIYRHVWLIKTNDILIADDGVFVYSNEKINKPQVFIESEI